MASGAPKSLAFILLTLNLVLYGIVTMIAGWAVNYGIERSAQTASALTIPAHIFPIYYPIGNMATGFFVIFALIAGLVGVATSITGISSILQWTLPNLLSAASYSVTTLFLTILAMGLACKEINLGFTDANLRTLEILTIIVSATQLFCVGAIHVGVTDAVKFTIFEESDLEIELLRELRDMSNVTVCARFRPLSSKEIRDHGDSTCIQHLDAETFVFKDEKGEDYRFRFDRVFDQGSEQVDVYEFLALPIVQDTVNAVNGTILAYGQTGAGKTYSMEGANIFGCDGNTKGLVPRVVDGIFECLTQANVMTVYTVKLSMVEIYMEKVRDLLDLSKDNLQIKEDKVQGIHLLGATEIYISDSAEALQNLSSGIANRAVGETNMNMASSRSHCAYIFTVQQEQHRRVKTGKLVLVDLAGSEKIEKTGAEGKVLEEAKTINKSLSALGNVIKALTSGTQGKLNHIPYRDSKLTRILQDALGGNSRTVLLCCCSPSTLNASESLSTLRFGARAKHIKTSPRVNSIRDKNGREQMEPFPTKDESYERTLDKLREKLKAEDVKLEESSDCTSIKTIESADEDETFETVSLLQRDVEELGSTVRKLKRENRLLKAKLIVFQKFNSHHENDGYHLNDLHMVLGVLFSFFFLALVFWASFLK
ncbi:hypothetical protein NE237_013590 [Protea cynaroides]|uniref:Kinesin-like protein n=1 Tax=Protea cynaroides TaxID=273540 RepID=A0A9Q0JZ48_9MAGN|nr:hypothetical protein NE237_013590 [Protea cynaroides]